MRAWGWHCFATLYLRQLIHLYLPIARVDITVDTRMSLPHHVDCSPHDVVYFVLNVTQPPPAVLKRR